MGRRAALAALLIAAAFIGVRHRVYDLYPAIDFAAWSRRDALMNWPRLAAFAAALAAMAAFGGVARWRWRGLSSSFLPLAVVAAAQTLGGATASFGERTMTVRQAAAGLGANVLVVLWEEACFRGLLYLGLRRARVGPVAAALWSSAAFTVMHWQAQPLTSWPWIFCYGLVSCAALEGGTGLVWLMLAHWVVDSPFFLSGGGDPVRSFELFSRFVSAAGAAWSLSLLSGTATRTAEA